MQKLHGVWAACTAILAVRLRRGRYCAVATLLALGLALVAGCGDCTPNFSRADRTPTPSPTPSAATGGGTIVIGVPTPAAVLCSPTPVTVAVNQRTVVDCSAQGYDGPFTLTVGDPTIASVQVATGTFTFFYVSGLKAGTTTLSLADPPSGTGSVQIMITP